MLFIGLFLTTVFTTRSCHCKVLFLEEFLDKRFQLRWLNSIDNIDKQGNFEIGAGPLTLNPHDGQGLKTAEDYRYYLLSRKMKRKYSNKNRNLIVQYQVVFPSLMECGGAYLKILGFDFEPATFSSKTPYKIMFGPDVCGFAFENRELKVILNYKGKYYTLNQILRYHISHIPQLFTLIIRPDNTYEVHINMSVVAKGSIGKDFRMLRPKMIRDKKAKPPEGVDTHEFILDSSAKPPPHIHQYPTIIDPKFVVNSSFFNLSCQPPNITNPDYMRPWRPPLIKNPKYKGKWIPPLIPNPNYNINDNFYLQSDLGGVGIDVWQMSSGVIYDNILLTDNEKFARKFAKERWKNVIEAILDAEKNAKPYNETMAEVEAAHLRSLNEEQQNQEFVDDDGLESCYNRIENMKANVFGPNKEQLEILLQEKRYRILRIREEMFSHPSPVPEFSFFDHRYFQGLSNDSRDTKKDLLEDRLKLINSHKITDTVKFVNDNNLNNF